MKYLLVYTGSYSTQEYYRLFENKDQLDKFCITDNVYSVVDIYEIRKVNAKE